MVTGSNMKAFMDADFLLENEVAKILYHNYAAKMPIVDYHNHLSAKEIYENKQYANLAEVWLAGDHYKWRQLRTNGINEKYITGDATSEEKMEAYAKTIPSLIGNPLYHWTHLELQRYFGVKTPLTFNNWQDIYHEANAALKQENFRARGLLEMQNVESLCTTDDPKDNLEYHKALKAEGYKIKVLPTYRPDNAIHIDKVAFLPYLKDLGAVVGYELTSAELVVKALKERLDYFVEAGCVIADHGLDQMMYAPATLAEVEAIYQLALAKETLTPLQISQYKGYIMVELAKCYHANNMVLQLHMGALRNNSTRRLNSIGVDSGFDSINNSVNAQVLSQFLDCLDLTDQLPKTILYTLNPNDNEVLATMCGNFQDGITAGKIQFGSGWWFNDQKDGMERQMEALMQLGMISRFVGMLTDSRSFLSFPRHEYFRRILCNKLAKLVVNGEYPWDEATLGQIVQDICYYNAKNYLEI